MQELPALAIHGRTPERHPVGEADWTKIAEVKNNPQIKIPIIGNGDVTSGEKAKRFLDQSGVDALMIGQGAMANHGFSRDKTLLKHREILPSPTIEEVVVNVREQLQQS